MERKQVLYLCMGSACHQLGGFRLVPLLQSLIEKYQLQERLELKGAFCLEKCEQGRSLKVGERVLTGLTPENIEELFVREILPCLSPR